jgi:hypothetical protein
MVNMEVHEHVVIEGVTARLRNPLIITMWNRSRVISRNVTSIPTGSAAC